MTKIKKDVTKVDEEEEEESKWRDFEVHHLITIRRKIDEKLFEKKNK